MANNDASSSEIRFNEISKTLEYAVGNIWVSAAVPQVLTTAQRDAITSPVEGTLIYNVTTHKLNVRAAAAWEVVTSA